MVSKWIYAEVSKRNAFVARGRHTSRKTHVTRDPLCTQVARSRSSKTPGSKAGIFNGALRRLFLLPGPTEVIRAGDTRY